MLGPFFSSTCLPLSAASLVPRWDLTHDSTLLMRPVLGRRYSASMANLRTYKRCHSALRARLVNY